MTSWFAHISWVARAELHYSSDRAAFQLGVRICLSHLINKWIWKSKASCGIIDWGIELLICHLGMHNFVDLIFSKWLNWVMLKFAKRHVQVLRRAVETWRCGSEQLAKNSTELRLSSAIQTTMETERLVSICSFRVLWIWKHICIHAVLFLNKKEPERRFGWETASVVVSFRFRFGFGFDSISVSKQPFRLLFV